MDSGSHQSRNDPPAWVRWAYEACKTRLGFDLDGATDDTRTAVIVASLDSEPLGRDAAMDAAELALWEQAVFGGWEHMLNPPDKPDATD